MSSPPGPLSRFATSAAQALGAPDKLSDYIQGPKQLIEHPIDSAKLLGGAMLDSQTSTAQSGLDRMHQPGLGNKLAGGLEYAESGIPLLGPALAHAGHQAESGDYAGAAGTTLGSAAPILAGEASRIPGEHPTVASAALEDHQATGGSTTDPRTGQSLTGARKWTVGVSPETTQITQRAPMPSEYSNFVAQHRDLLQEHPNSAVGTQLGPDGLHRLEVVGLTGSKQTAASLGSDLGENSIYHIGRDEEFGLGTSGPRQPHPTTVTERLQRLEENSPKAQTYSGTHYSATDIGDEGTIEGSRRGIPSGSGKTAQPPVGAESIRLKLGSSTGLGPDAPPGFYSYKSGTLPDPVISSRPNAIPVRGQFAFGSPDSPEFQQAYHNVGASALSAGADPQTAHGLGLNAGEHALRDAGYDGYSSPAHPGTQFIFDDHKLYHGANAAGTKAIESSGKIAPEPLTQAHLTPNKSTADAYARANGGKTFAVNAGDVPPEAIQHYAETGRGPIVLNSTHSVPVAPAPQGMIPGPAPELNPSWNSTRQTPTQYGFDRRVSTGPQGPDPGAVSRQQMPPLPRGERRAVPRSAAEQEFQDLFSQARREFESAGIDPTTEQVESRVGELKAKKVK